MKIQLASDLHLEHVSRIFPGETLINRNCQADVLVLAGDIHNNHHALDLFKDFGRPVIYVMGNHEAYGHDIDDVRARIARECKDTDIHFLDNDEVIIQGVRFLGATMWSDFKIDGRPQAAQMASVGRSLYDFHVITKGDKTFSTSDALAEHQKTAKWLLQKLGEPFNGKTVVVTHHGPHRKSIHPRWLGTDINGGFVSDMSRLLAKCDVWMHGHVHDSFQYTAKKCRVIANPHGYILNRSSVRSLADVVRENPGFDPSLVIEV